MHSNLNAFVGSVLLCHFLSAFSVLGMTLFIPRILQNLDANLPGYWVGLLFTLPSVCTALSAPLWGRFADRFGKRTSLLRAQLGLIIGFLLCGFAESISTFAIGLLVQGACGGTIAASNAFLSTRQKGETLAKSLNLTQISARMALIIAPILLGVTLQWIAPLQVYRYLALLPFIAVLITLNLPADTPHTSSNRRAGAIPLPRALHLLFILQFLFCFAMVATYPYFLPYAGTLGVTTEGLVGLLYSLPHVVYILLIVPAGKIRLPAQGQALLGLLCLGLSCTGQYLAVSLEQLWPLRLLFGIGVVFAYTGLNRLLSAQVDKAQAGRTFGFIDSAGKWGGVLAGLGAATSTSIQHSATPFLLSAVSCGIAITLLAFKTGSMKIHGNTEVY